MFQVLWVEKEGKEEEERLEAESEICNINNL